MFLLYFARSRMTNFPALGIIVGGGALAFSQRVSHPKLSILGVAVGVVGVIIFVGTKFWPIEESKSAPPE